MKRACVVLLMLLGSVAWAGPARPWREVRSWVYQLQGADPAAIAASPADLAVVDRSRDGTEAGAYRPDEVAAMQRSPRGRRLVLAYLSIGEAEDYRWYWKPAFRREPPAWLDAENPDWPGNFKVRYWHAEWQAIVLDGLRRARAQGFDGVYLDIIDAYEYFEERGVDDAADRMVELVRRIAAAGGAGFGVFPQNGEGLLDRPEYLEAITGIAREEVFYGYEGEDGRPTPPEETDAIGCLLDRARRAGRLVLTVDYTKTPAQARLAYQRAKARGWAEYCTVRALDRLVPPGAP